MNWPAILAPLMAPNFLVTVLVITVASLLLAFDCIDAAMMGLEHRQQLTQRAYRALEAA